MNSTTNRKASAKTTKRKKKSAARKRSVSHHAKTKRSASSGNKKIAKLVIVAVIFVALTASLLSYLSYLYTLVDSRFADGLWEKPSRVYARPYVTYTGQKSSLKQLSFELQNAGYEAVGSTPQQGQFHIDGNTMTLVLDDVSYLNSQQPAGRYSLTVNQGKIDSISLQQKKIDVLVLPPALIGSFIPSNGEDRLLVEQEDLPKLLIETLIAVEDRRFYQHNGIDPLSIMRAFWANIRAGKTVQGGSTLTQQLAKNLFLTPSKTLVRKINEALLAILIEARLDKSEILLAYINEVYLMQHHGLSIHGFGLASKLLFDQKLSSLTEDQIAMMVGMVKGPGIYNPISQPENTRKRRNQVLNIMQQQGLITENSLQPSLSKPIQVNTELPPLNPYPAFLDLVKQQLLTTYPEEELKSRGLSIYTTLELQKQRALEQSVSQLMPGFNNPRLEIAAVIANPLQGDILAVIGGRQSGYQGFNRALNARRPIGSLIKPLILYLLLEQGMTLADLVDDRTVRVELSDGSIWEPKNFGRRSHGRVLLYDAFINSYNQSFVRLGLEQNLLPPLKSLLKATGNPIDGLIYPSSLLGSVAMSPLQVTQMMQAIANGGFHVPQTTIREVVDEQGRQLQRIPIESLKIMDEDIIRLVQSSLIGVTREGTAKKLQQSLSEVTVAGKTGTSNDLRDSWFSGFSSSLLTTVWMGMDDNTPAGLTGSSGALKVWQAIMKNTQSHSFLIEPTETIEWYPVNRSKGLRTPAYCRESVLLPFIKGTRPRFTATCD